jgi:hypothetical protein
VLTSNSTTTRVESALQLSADFDIQRRQGFQALSDLLQTCLDLPIYLMPFVNSSAIDLPVNDSKIHLLDVARKASARGIAQYLALRKAQELLAHLPSEIGYHNRQASSRWLPWLHQQEVLHIIGLHWGMLAEALPCNAADFVCSCLIEAERTSETRNSHFFDHFHDALLDLLRQVLLQMQSMPDVGANDQFLLYQHTTSVYPSTSSQSTFPASLVAGSSEYISFIQASFRNHTTGTGSSWVSDLQQNSTS